MNHAESLQQAMAYHKAGRLAEAEKLYRAILQMQPHHSDANHNLGILALQLDQPQAALPLLATALTVNPAIGQYWLSLAECWMQLHAWDKAESLLNDAESTGLPHEATTELRSRIAEQWPSTAKTGLDGVSKLLARVPLLFKKLLRLFQNGQCVAAESVALQILDRVPHQGKVSHLLGLIYLQQNKNAAAVAALTNASIHLPQDAEVWDHLGVAQRRTTDHAAAEESFKRSLEIDPLRPETWNNAGNNANDAGQFANGSRYLRMATDLNPNFIEAHNNLGVALTALGELDAAMIACRRALALNPNYADAHYNLGNVLLERGQLDVAISSYRRALELKPEFANALSNLGVALKQVGQLDAASTSYRSALELQPDSAELHNNLGNVLQDLGQLDAAVLSYKRALKLKADYAEAYSNLGATLRALGQHDAAIDSYQRALDFAPGLSIALKGKIDVYIADNRRHDAVSLVNKLIADLSLPTTLPPLEHEPQVTALLPFGRAGSMFFHSLFDGHPQVSTLPGVYFKGWFGRDVWQRFAPSKGDENWRRKLVEILFDEFEPLFDARSKRNVIGKPLGFTSHLAGESGFMEMGPDRNIPFMVKKDAFMSALLDLLQPIPAVTQRDCFELVHRAFDQAVGRGNEAKHIFYHIHNPDEFELANFLSTYPQSRLLHIVRHPIQGMESWMLQDLCGSVEAINLLPSTGDNDGRTDRLLNRWLNAVGKVETMFAQLQSPFNSLANNRGVRLEDIKRCPHMSMRQIAAWMGIDEHPALYDASFCGLQYWGPSSKMTGRISGFDTKAIDQQVGRLLGKRDIQIFEILFWPFSRRYRYTEMDEKVFRARLTDIRPWLDEPLQFEEHLYARLKKPHEVLKKISPYCRMHRLLLEHWTMLDRDFTYHGMLEPLEIQVDQ